ncbi:aspartic proteinase nepenthesin-1-like [Panicum miliaceum]|uniref:Aspartic proteinase nepenthesin-1-like n=1 Tax=Panicum miliaceum TaxID=4540 RepID=A0A3L6T0L9_PANMI|nr:aspartic proteinase nepenthesin-1-like [Panicum miliaceum]
MAPTTALVSLVLLCLSNVLIICSGGGGAGIRMKLTHVDAKGSYTAEERVRRAVAASRQRLASMRASGGVSAPVHWSTRQYIAEYLVGDPPQRAEAIIDTGSDLIWTQSTACLRKVCARQDLPYFNASASGSFAPVPCRDRARAANYRHLCALDGGCTFMASYGAGSVIGFLGTDAFAFQSGGAALAFGCVSFTRVTPGALHGASGLIGLGRGRLSLVSQTGATRFSYCLTPYFHNNGASSHLFVGAAASLSGGGPVTSMPFVESPKDFPYSTFYYLPLEGITVGGTKLPIPSSAFDLRQVDKGYWAGGVIIDSGSPFTSLAEAAYEPLRDELAGQLNGSLVAPPADSRLELCVARGDVGRVVPKLVLHFGGGADMALPPGNYWAPVDKSTACMAILEAYDQSIIGNFQQQNMHLLFDVGGGRFSFQTADCSTL